MFFDVLTLFPNMFDGILSESILSRAIKKGLITVKTDNIRDYTTDKHNTADDEAYGGEPGMVMKPEPTAAAIKAAKDRHKGENFRVIHMSPHGKVIDHEKIAELSKLDGVVLLCGHYKGIDHRIREHLITKEISIGDYVLTGGELAAAVICDAVIRLIPGALGDESSALSDSFQDNLLAPPVYTRPAEFNGWKVPEILLQGNAAAVDQWKFEQSLERTRQLRPEMLEGEELLKE